MRRLRRATGIGLVMGQYHIRVGIRTRYLCALALANSVITRGFCAVPACATLRY